MEYYSTIEKNSFESVLMRGMKLEPIIQSEVSQKDNNTTLTAEGKKELKSLLKKVKEESEKFVLKQNIKKIKMSSGPITSW